MTEALRSAGLKRVRMRVATAVVIMFTLTCAGSFGMEDVVVSSGPGFTLLMIAVLPWIWSVPMALVSAELGSAVPEAGGLYRWIRRALGEYWSFQAGWWWSLSLYVDSAVYVALALGYVQTYFDLSSFERWAIGAVIVAAFIYINIRGLDLTGLSLWIIEALIIIPYAIFVALALVKGTGHPFTPFMPEGQGFMDSLGLGLSIMMWMYAGYESMSTLAGEVENPQRIIPRALLIDVPLVIAFYFITVVAVIMAAGEGNWTQLTSDASTGGIDFVEAAKAVGGGFVGALMFMAAIASNIGLYTGYLATGSRPAYQMSRDRLFPRFLGKAHPKYGTPWVAILMMGLVNMVLIAFDFSTLIVIDVFLLMFSYIVIYIAAIVLRIREPNLPRPFRVPMPTWLLAVYTLFPISIAVLALFTNGDDYLVGGLVGVLSGPVAYLVFKYLYHGVKDEALEDSVVTPTGELTEYGAAIEGVAE